MIPMNETAPKPETEVSTPSLGAEKQEKQKTPEQADRLELKNKIKETLGLDEEEKKTVEEKWGRINQLLEEGLTPEKQNKVRELLASSDPEAGLETEEIKRAMESMSEFIKQEEEKKPGNKMEDIKEKAKESFEKGYEKMKKIVPLAAIASFLEAVVKQFKFFGSFLNPFIEKARKEEIDETSKKLFGEGKYDFSEEDKSVLIDRFNQKRPEEGKEKQPGQFDTLEAYLTHLKVKAEESGKVPKDGEKWKIGNLLSKEDIDAAKKQMQEIANEGYKIIKDAKPSELLAMAQQGIGGEEKEKISSQLKRLPSITDEDINKLFNDEEWNNGLKLAAKSLLTQKLNIQTGGEIDIEKSEPNKIIINMKGEKDGKSFEGRYSVKKEGATWKIESDKPLTIQPIPENQTDKIGLEIDRAFQLFINSQRDTGTSTPTAEPPTEAPSPEKTTGPTKTETPIPEKDSYTSGA